MDELEFYEKDDDIDTGQNNFYSKPVRKKKKFYQIIFLILALVLIFFTLIFYLFHQLKIKYDRIFFGNGVNSTIDNFKKVLIPGQLSGEDSGDINMLFVGMRSKDMEGAYYSSAMMIVNLDLKTNKLNLISVPRDLWMPIGNSLGKANSVYKTTVENNSKSPTENINFTKETFAKNFGIDINYVFVCDFDSFQNIINQIGRIDIQMSETEAAGYPFLSDNLMKSARDRSTPGLYHLDGAQSLEFVRWPIDAVPDFDRLRRMQLYLFSFAKQYVDTKSLMTYKTANNVLGVADDNIRTDMKIWEIKKIVGLAEKIPLGSVSQHRLTTDIGTDGGLLKESHYQNTTYNPIAGDSNFSQIQTWTRNIINN